MIVTIIEKNSQDVKGLSAFFYTIKKKVSKYIVFLAKLAIPH
jgi:hypothetical protein